MEKTFCTIEEMKLAGLSARTKNADEMNPETSKIGQIVEKYMGENIAERLQNRLETGRQICAYTEYESDETAPYTFFMGEEVGGFENQDQDLATLTIPAQKYVKFTTDPGPMPQVVIEAWQKIWEMDAEALGGKRTYGADFEVYDIRALNPENVVLDIYIGIEG